MFSVSIALVSLVDTDRQWFKSRQGLEPTEPPRSISFCGHAILGVEAYVVEDTSLDPRFCDNPLVTDGPKIRFYAGHPLHGPRGHRLGTLCLIDEKPRTLSPGDLAILDDLASMVEDELAALATATTDSLTGLSNRAGFQRLPEHTLRSAKRRGEPCQLIYIDMNEFKPINDLHGHAVGDDALREMASLLLRSLRASDVIARLGGDEFVALLEGKGAAHGLKRLQNATDRRNQSTDTAYQLSYSVGTASFDPESPTGLASLLDEADRAMLTAKASGPR